MPETCVPLPWLQDAECIELERGTGYTMPVSCKSLPKPVVRCIAQALCLSMYITPVVLVGASAGACNP
ncbi:hypothetical protein ACVWYF_004540 [Hymenobacter sp. UYAg731]